MSVFNDRAAGITSHVLTRVNGLPCGFNGSDSFLICMKAVQITSRQSQKDIFLILRRFYPELRNILSQPQNKDAQWLSLFFSNLAALVFDPYISEPKLNLERGTGMPIEENGMALYLRLPTHFSLPVLISWAKERGESGWSDPNISAFLEMPYREFLASKILFNGRTAIRARELFQPDAIQISKIGVENPSYADAFRERDELESRLNPERAEMNRNIEKICHGDLSCLSQNQFTGSVQIIRGAFFYGGYLVNGHKEGPWKNISADGINDGEEIYANGELKAAKLYGVDEYGSRYLKRTESYYQGRDSGVMTSYRSDNSVEREMSFNDAGDLVVEAYYCSDGISLERIIHRDTSGGTDTRSFLCP